VKDEGKEERKVDVKGEDEDRMEGVRYRFQDRVAASKASTPGNGAARKPSKSTTPGQGEDVEMADAGNDDDAYPPAAASSEMASRTVSASASAANSRAASTVPSRTGTPLAAPINNGATARGPSASVGTNGSASRAGSVAEAGSKESTPAAGGEAVAAQPRVVKVLKRPAAASPFLPKTKRPGGGGR
jgi:senataxin